MSHFLDKLNIQLLWEVLMDEEILYSKSKYFINHISNQFNNNLIPFYENEKRMIEPSSQNLVLFNKKYISFMIDTINQLENKIIVSAEKSKNVNSLQNKKEMVTYEELQEERKSKFDQELNKKQEEFQKAITLSVPPTPNFGDKIEEEKPPISELERRIQQTIAERNFVLEQPNYSSNDINKATNWLNSQETSVKKDKMNRPDKIEKIENHSIKLIKIKEPILNENIIQPIYLEEIPKTTKHIKWNQNLEESIDYNENNEYDFSPNSFSENHLFSKLKILPKNSEFIKDEKYEKIEKEIKINQLEEEIQILYQKIDEMQKTIQDIKRNL